MRFAGGRSIAALRMRRWIGALRRRGQLGGFAKNLALFGEYLLESAQGGT
jgi:hypothetical protein